MGTREISSSVHEMPDYPNCLLLYKLSGCELRPVGFAQTGVGHPPEEFSAEGLSDSKLLSRLHDKGPHLRSASEMNGCSRRWKRPISSAHRPLFGCGSSAIAIM